ncbi:xanthine dehydrogenase family protein molybdopterin-binding subunit [Croceicoccus sediminis]|uniref:xanthine dehydrogenase family protein molybdopterin-binding subunit n=1 Tax=Croceicoccus sediminis TaxID=2571150 RepID=UPI0011844C1A|nr:xanthine dehydrogenase family protein molybdopterin-binding subunit [Croceicoccus sediminis]
MKFDAPIGDTPIDNGRVVGRPHSRVEGPLKVTGRATYAAEWHEDLPAMLYGAIVPATIAKGTVKAVDPQAARQSPGVVEVLTFEDIDIHGTSSGRTVKMVGGPEVQHYHQALGIVIAETFEQARAAAALVHFEYEVGAGSFSLDGGRADAKVCGAYGGPGETRLGDFEAAFEAGEVRFDAEYRTGAHSPAMIEPFASIAQWQGDDLMLWTSNQMIAGTRGSMASMLRLDEERVRIFSPYVGGGFGAKLWANADAILAAIAAKKVGRPVKVVMPRGLIFNNTINRPETIQRLRIAARADGTIEAFGHEGWSGNVKGGNPESTVMASRSVYAGPNRLMADHMAHLDLPEGNAVRAPGDAVGSIAVEIAMDEMAEKLGLDPIEFRVINDSQVDPSKPEKTFTNRHLVRCLRDGAERFGWGDRMAPGTRRDGKWLIGMGVATAYRAALRHASGAAVRLETNGRITVETDMTDIGTGSYTILAQTAGEMLGVSVDRVDVRLGDSRFPVSAGSGGQWGASSSTSGLYVACVNLRRSIAERLSMDAERVEFEGGEVRSGNRVCSLLDAVAGGPVEAEGKFDFAQSDTKAFGTFGAHFVEVGVDAYTGEVRVRRMLAVCSAGRILNPVSARSQVIGAMTWGVGAALSEKLEVDERYGCFLNHDLALYEVPVHADIPHQDVVFLDDLDPHGNPMKAHGVGELGLCGVGGAIANAVYNATGTRLRKVPMMVEDIIPHLPEPV